MNNFAKGKNEASGKYTESDFKMYIDEGVEIDVLVS